MCKSSANKTHVQGVEPGSAQMHVKIHEFGEYRSFHYSGTIRQYLLHIPDSIRENAPLVCMLHGYTSSAKEMIKMSGMNNLADRYGFAVVYPQGLPDMYGETCWNSRLDLTNTDDTGFLIALIKYLQQAYCLNSKTTFAAGFSNGGFMCYTLVCDVPGIFRAIASVSGTMSRETWGRRDSSVSVPVLQIYGTSDIEIPIDGSLSLSGDWGGTPPFAELIAHWADADGTHDLETVELSDKTTAYQYSGVENDNLVWYHEIEGHPHSWPKKADAGFNAEDLIWKFFSNYTD